MQTFDQGEFLEYVSKLKIPLNESSVEYSKLKTKIKWRFKVGT